MCNYTLSRCKSLLAFWIEQIHWQTVSGFSLPVSLWTYFCSVLSSLCHFSSLPCIVLCISSNWGLMGPFLMSSELPTNLLMHTVTFLFLNKALTLFKCASCAFVQCPMILWYFGLGSFNKQAVKLLLLKKAPSAVKPSRTSEQFMCSPFRKIIAL